MAIDDSLTTSDSPAKETTTTDHEPRNQEAKGKSPANNVVYKTKEITYRGRKTHIVLQNQNGPCPLIAICNILFLRNDRNLYPYTLEVSQERLFTIVRETLIFANINEDIFEDGHHTENLSQDVSDAIDRLPSLAHGINFNPKFTSIADFEPTPELDIYRLLNIRCYHGWLVDPQDFETSGAIGDKSYNDLTIGLVALEPLAPSSRIPGGFSVDRYAANTIALGECYKTRFSADSPSSSSGHRNFGEGDIKQCIPLLGNLAIAAEREKLGFDISGHSGSEEESDTSETSVDTAAECTGNIVIGLCQESKADDYVPSMDSEDKTDCDVVNKINVGEEVDSTSAMTKSSGALIHDQVSSTELGDDAENNSKVTAAHVTSHEAISEEKTNLKSAENENISEILLKTEAVTIGNPDISGRSQDDDQGGNWKGKSILEESSSKELTPEEGEVIRNFLSENASQLTVHGLFSLIRDVPEDELCVLFRNNHISTMLKHKNELYLLVTDQGYLTVKDVVWEKLNEVNGDSVYMTGDFEVFSSESRKRDQQQAIISKVQKWNQEHTVSNITDHIFNINSSSKQDLDNDPDLKMAMQLQEEELGGGFNYSQVQWNDDFDPYASR